MSNNNSTLEIKSNSIYIQFTTGNISPLRTHPPTSSSLLTTFLLQLDNSNLNNNNNNKYTEDNNSSDNNSNNNNSDNDNNRNDSKQSRIKQVVRNIEEYFTEFSHFQYSPPVCYKIEEGEEEKEMEDNKKVKYVVVFPSVVEAKIAISNLHLRYASFIPTYLHFSFGPVIGYEIAKLRRRKMISTLTTNQHSNKISSNGNGSGSGNGEDSNKLQIPRMMMSTKYCLLSPPPSPPPNWKPLEERAIVKNEKGEKGMKVGFDLAEPKLIDEVKLQCGSSLKTFLLHSSVEFFHPLIPSPDNTEDDDDVIYDATTAFNSSCGIDGDDGDDNNDDDDDDEIEKIEPPTIILTVIEKC